MRTVWHLCSPLAVGDFGPPWRSIATDLHARLEESLAQLPHDEVAALAASRDHAACVALLRAGQSAPPPSKEAAPHKQGKASHLRLLLLLLLEIRCLSEAVAPAAGALRAPPTPTRDSVSRQLPGKRLEYECLVWGPTPAKAPPEEPSRASPHGGTRTE